MNRVVTDVEAGWGKYKLLIRGVEALRCSECGEEEFSSSEAQLIENLSRGLVGQPTKPDVLNVEEVADLLRVSKQTVYNLLKSGKLSAARVGREWRFSRESIMALLSSEEIESQAATCVANLQLAARLAPGSHSISQENARKIKKHVSEIVKRKRA